MKKYYLQVGSQKIPVPQAGVPRLLQLRAAKKQLAELRKLIRSRRAS
jgi:hypothetical protein